MVDPVAPNLGPIGEIRPGAPAQGPGAPPKGRSFKEILLDSIEEVNQLQNQADAMIGRLSAGEPTEITDVLVAVEKADLAFKTLMQIRNKLVDAYEELNRMRV